MSKQLEVAEVIVKKADQINVISLIAQAGKIEELNADKIENLFGLIIELSKEISSMANSKIFTEEKLI